MPTTITKNLFGKTTDGADVHKYTMTNTNGIILEVLDFGGIVTSIKAPDRNGILSDITTGFDTMAEYEKNPAYFGALVGRVANRIFEGKFILEGKEYQVACNRGEVHLHGGNVGFDKKIWKCVIENNILKLTYVSVDGEECYPGTLTVNVTYELNDENEFYIHYEATTDKTTILNLTNHAYFNLAGHESKNVYDHVININADHYLPKTEHGVPTGELRDVIGTAFDLRQPHNLGEGLHKVEGPPTGYDHNFCINPDGKEKQFAVRVSHPPTGRVLEVYTNQPGIQLYTGNFLDALPGKNGAIYNQHSSFALETQNYPDAIHHENFPSCTLEAGKIYDHKTWYKFTVEP